MRADHGRKEEVRSMNAREELAALIESGYAGDDGDCPYEHAPSIADAILAAGYRKPRTITTAEELDALPLESVVKSAEGNVWEFLVGGWFETASRVGHVASDLALPATVLYEPEAAA